MRIFLLEVGGPWLHTQELGELGGIPQGKGKRKGIMGLTHKRGECVCVKIEGGGVSPKLSIKLQELPPQNESKVVFLEEEPSFFTNGALKFGPWPFSH